MASTDRKGTTVVGVITSAEKTRFMTKTCKSLKQDGSTEMAPFHKIPLPSIVHTIIASLRSMHRCADLFRLSSVST